MPPQAAGGLVVYTRAGCPPCEEMVADLAAWIGGRAIPVTVVDVDSDPDACERYGLLVPVLELDGTLLLRGRFDPAVLAGRFGE